MFALLISVNLLLSKLHFSNFPIYEKHVIIYLVADRKLHGFHKRKKNLEKCNILTNKLTEYMKNDRNLKKSTCLLQFHELR